MRDDHPVQEPGGQDEDEAVERGISPVGESGGGWGRFRLGRRPAEQDEDEDQADRSVSPLAESGGSSRFRLGQRSADRDEEEDYDPGPKARVAPATDRADVEGERGISPVAGRFGQNHTTKALGAVGLGLAATVLLFATWDRGESKEADAGAERAGPAKQVVAFEPAAGEAPPLPPSPTLAGPQDPGAPTLLGAPGEQRVPAVDPGYTSQMPASAYPMTAAPVERVAPRENPAAVLLESARRAPVLAFTQKRSGGGQAFGGYPQLAQGPRDAAPDDNQLARLTRGSQIGEVRAHRLPDRNYLITAGTVLPCVLQTALDSSTPGYATCLIPRNVYSDNGAVVLMEKGTRVLGEYRDGLRRGQKRLFVLWTRAVTPEGVAIELASPASDALGRSGFDGRIENFFWQRFGGALLLSVVDDVVYVAGDRGGFQNTTRLPSDAAGIALENSINIPPVLRKRAGEEVGIFVNKDLNFADVYGLQPRAAR